MREGLPGDRRRIEHNVDTAFLTLRGAVKARPACTTFLPALCAGRCVPFIKACDRVATSRSFKLGLGFGLGIGLGLGLG